MTVKPYPTGSIVALVLVLIAAVLAVLPPVADAAAGRAGAITTAGVALLVATVGLLVAALAGRAVRGTTWPAATIGTLAGMTAVCWIALALVIL